MRSKKGKPNPVRDATLEAIKSAGGIRKLSEEFAIHYESVRLWAQAGRIPVERVLRVEALSGIPRHELRPDIYPPELA